MTTLRFASDPQSEFTIEIDMVPNWSDSTIRWNGEVVGESVTKSQLHEGITINHPDGRSLTVVLPKKALSLPVVRVDDHLYTLCVQDHQRTLKNGKSVLCLLAIGNLLLPLYAAVNPDSDLAPIGSDPLTIAMGALFLGLFIWSRYSAKWPLAIGTVVYAIALGLGIKIMVNAGLSLVSFPVFIRVVFLVYLIRGFLAVRTIENRYPKSPDSVFLS